MGNVRTLFNMYVFVHVGAPHRPEECVWSSGAGVTGKLPYISTGNPAHGLSAQTRSLIPHVKV